jgi:hypothetical protein
MLKLKHILASMIYFDSDMSKSTNMVVYFDWKTVIYIYICRKRSHTIYAANGKVSHIHLRMWEWDYTIDKSLSFVYKAKEGGHVKIIFFYFQNVIDKTIEKYGRLDFLLNNAGTRESTLV